jgi:hypothetical protein
MARQVSRSGKTATTAGQSAVSKLASVTAIPEPKDINYKVDAKLTTYNFQGKAQYDWDISENVTDIRVLPDTTQASTVEIDLDDSDYSFSTHCSLTGLSASKTFRSVAPRSSRPPA